MSGWFENQADEDFSRARTRELLSHLAGLLDPARESLLPFEDVVAILKPGAQTYVGVEAIEVDRIVGSEGRYRDFNRHFLPRREFLRSRWKSIDMAHYEDVPLPPVRIYEVGGVYFVRDGNHRVSVARMRGQTMIDAEVTKLDTLVDIKPGMTLEDLKRELILYEKRLFYEKTEFGAITGYEGLDFTSPGRYDEIMDHILVHKYYLNQGFEGELSFADALWSWYENVFRPIILTIQDEGLLFRFPGRTASDLYMFLVQHWDELKRKYGLSFSLGEAARDYSDRFGTSPLWRLGRRLQALAGAILATFKNKGPAEGKDGNRRA